MRQLVIENYKGLGVRRRRARDGKPAGARGVLP